MRIILLNILIILSLGFIPVSADTIHIRADEWCPYNCKPDSDYPGYMIEMARTIFERNGHTLVYETMPWARSIDYCRKGKIDAVAGATVSEASDFVFPSACQGWSMVAFFVRKGHNWKYVEVDSLSTVRTGILDDYDYGEELLMHYFKTNAGSDNVQVVGGIDPLGINIRKLLKGRIDVLPEDRYVFYNKIRTLGLIGHFQEAGMIPVTNPVEYEATRVYPMVA